MIILNYPEMASRFKYPDLLFHLLYAPLSAYKILHALLIFNLDEWLTLLLAIRLHGPQLRKYNHQPYWYHVLEVATTVKYFNLPTTTVCAALLHDVLEDRPVSRLQLYLKLIPLHEKPNAEKITSMVDELTDQYTHQNYPYWNRARRKAEECQRLARTRSEVQNIKLADILSNAASIRKHDPDFFKVFQKECFNLVKSLNMKTSVILRHITYRSLEL